MKASSRSYPAKHLVNILAVAILLGAAVTLDNIFFETTSLIDLVYALPIITAAMLLSPLEVVVVSLLAMLLCFSAQVVEGEATYWWIPMMVGGLGILVAVKAALIRRWRQRMQAIGETLASSPLAFATLKFPGYTVLDHDETFRRMIAAGKETSLRGRRLSELLPEESSQRLSDFLDRAVSSRSKADSREFHLVTGRGKGSYWNINAVPTRNPGRKTPRSVTLIALEVTDSVHRARSREAALRISNAMMASLDMDDTIRVVLDSLAYAADTNAGALFLLEDDQWIGKAGFGEYSDTSVQWLRLPYDDLETAVAAVENRDTLAIEDAAGDHRFSPEHVERFRIRSSLVTPLVTGNKTIGVVWLNQTDGRRSFSPDQIKFATTVGAQAALAIDNATAYENEYTMRKSLEAIEMVSEAGLTSLDLEEVLLEIVSRTQDVMQTEAAVIMLADDKNEYLQARAAAGSIVASGNQLRVKVGEGLVGRAYREGVPMKIDDISDHESDMCPFAENSGVRSVLAVPLRLEGKTAGVLQIGSQQRRAFTAREWGLIQVLADRASMAVQNSMLFDETRQQLARAELLRKVASACAASDDLREIADRSLDAIYHELGCGVAAIFFYDRERNEMVTLASMGFPEKLSGVIGRISLDMDMLLAASVKAGKLLTHEDDEARAPDEKRIMSALEMDEDSRRATTPILYRGRVVGGMAMAFHDQRPFTENELTALRSLADQLAVAFSKTDHVASQSTGDSGSIRAGSGMGQSTEPSG